MSPDAWAEFWRVTVDFWTDALLLMGVGAYLGWHLRGRSDRKAKR